MMHGIRNCYLFVVYWSLKIFRYGPKPLDPEEIIQNFEPFSAVPTFRYFHVWPVDLERPRWLPAYRTPDHIPSKSNLRQHPERAAINVNLPAEGGCSRPADVIKVVDARRGAMVMDVRWVKGHQNISDVWCRVELPHSFLRPDLQIDPKDIWWSPSPLRFFYAWVPAIWLARV